MDAYPANPQDGSASLAHALIKFSSHAFASTGTKARS
ncbi:MAG: hypothetical protein ACI841_000969, partial [Planctomycetota bacterium]